MHGKKGSGRRGFVAFLSLRSKLVRFPSCSDGAWLLWQEVDTTHMLQDHTPSSAATPLLGVGARNASDKSALDVAVGKANTDIADYLKGALPDGGERLDQSQSKAGFKRAGRWMGLARADGFLEDLVSGGPGTHAQY